MKFKPNSHLFTASLFLCAISVLGGCGSQEASYANITWPAAALSPELKQSYNRSCKNCHESRGTGAPLTGDQQAWDAVLEKSMNLTVEKAISGSGGMPPGGQCFECTPEQMELLIRYMSNPAIES